MNDSGGKQDEADGAMAPMQALEPVGGLFLALAVQADGLRHEGEQGSAGCERGDDFNDEDDGHADAPFVLGGAARRHCTVWLRAAPHEGKLIDAIVNQRKLYLARRIFWVVAGEDCVLRIDRGVFRRWLCSVGFLNPSIRQEKMPLTS